MKIEVNSEPLLVLTGEDYKDPGGSVVVEIMSAAYQLRFATTVDDVIAVREELRNLADAMGELPLL